MTNAIDQVEVLLAELKAAHEQNSSAAQNIASIMRQIDLLDQKFTSLESAIKTDGRGQMEYIGLDPANVISRYFEKLPENALYEALYGGSVSLRGSPSIIGLKSSLCQQLHFSLDEFRYWMLAMDRRPRLHRKDWEWFYVAQALFERGKLSPDKIGLGFAVGREPLPALFASLGCEILATDQSIEQAEKSGWAYSGQYSEQVEGLFHQNICCKDVFFRNVRYKSIDMREIPENQSGIFDFCWSSCAFEHLGSLELGMKFVERSMDTLKPGGVAVHTTEFNLSSNDDTIEHESVSIYRRRDIEALVARLERAGHRVEPFDWSLGNGFAEIVVDLPPYKQSPHIRLRSQQFDCTSVGMIIQKTQQAAEKPSNNPVFSGLPHAGAV